MVSNKKILHICSNYVGTKIFPNLLAELNSAFGQNFLFCPLGKCVENYKKFSYLSENDEVLKINEEYAQIATCYTRLDRLLFFPKRKKIYEFVKNNYPISAFHAIVAHSLFTDGSVARLLNKEYQIPYVVFVQNSDINVFFKIPFLKKHGLDILYHAKSIIFCSPIVKQKVFDQYVSDSRREEMERKTEIIPFGIENVFIDNISFESRKPISSPKTIKMITVGTIDTNKNQLTVAKAIERLIKKGYQIEYNLVGKIVDKKYLRRLKKYSFVNYLGVKTYLELIDLYRENDIFVLASIHETFGLVYAEAMTQALPIIYTQGQGFDGQFADGEVGYAVQSRNVKEIAEKMEKILTNYESLSASARECSKEFAWKNVAAQYYRVAIGL